MKITVPFRLTLSGGGTDLCEYYRRHSGFVTTAAINLLMTVEITPGGRNPGTWTVGDDGQITDNRPHPYAIAAGWPTDTLVEIRSPVASGSGLGGSGALMVALLLARYPEFDEHRAELAAAAFNLERYALGKPVGQQDHWIAALGGTVAIDIETDGTVMAYQTRIPERFEERLLLVRTGIQRDAAAVLRSQAGAVRDLADPERAMREIEQIGLKIWRNLEHRNGDLFGPLTLAHWRAKCATDPKVTTPEIDHWIDLGMRHGAEGAKCCGAGAGGYLLFVVQPERRAGLVRVLAEAGLEETPFRFTNERARIVE